MNPRITSIENLIAADPGGRNVFGLMVADQLRLAAQSLRLARRVGIVSGFYVAEAQAGETDGPPGAKVLGGVLGQLGVEVDYITDSLNAPLFHSLGLNPIVDTQDYLDRAQPTHLVSIERVGRSADGRYRNMRGVDITDVTAPLDELFLEAGRRGLTTIGVGDGGNEIGMGKVFVSAIDTVKLGRAIATTVSTDFCIAAGVSNWGAYGLAGALSVLAGRDLLPSAGSVVADLEAVVHNGGAVDGVTHRREPTTDGLGIAASLRVLESIRRHIAPSPLAKGQSLLVGIVGYGEAGRAAVALLTDRGHRVCISDKGPVTLEPGLVAAGVEAGGHSVDFLSNCDLVVLSPGVRADGPLVDAIHQRGIPVMSELELAYQIGFAGDRPTRRLVAVTGTIGKRTTVELLQHVFQAAGESLTIGGNRGKPLSELLLAGGAAHPIALAVSSFQLESVVQFRPHVAVLLNINDAHLDRHQSIAEYIRIKSRAFMNHRPNDALILPFDDERLRPLARKHQGRTLFVSSRQGVDRGAWLVGGEVRLNVDGIIETAGSANPPFAEDLLAAVLVARLCGLSTERIAHAIEHLRAEGEPL